MSRLIVRLSWFGALYALGLALMGALVAATRAVLWLA
jgi:hypothetical protein